MNPWIMVGLSAALMGFGAAYQVVLLKKRQTSKDFSLVYMGAVTFYTAINTALTLFSANDWSVIATQVLNLATILTVLGTIVYYRVR